MTSYIKLFANSVEKLSLNSLQMHIECIVAYKEIKN